MMVRSSADGCYFADRLEIWRAFFRTNFLAYLFEFGSGKGWTYTFDYIGSFDYAVMACCGTGRGILQPVLDKQIGGDKRHNPSESEPLPREEATKALKDAFTAAGERDVYTGDSVKFFLITKEGIEKERFGLRLD